MSFSFLQTCNIMRLVLLFVILISSHSRLRENYLTKECVYYLTVIEYEIEEGGPSERHACDIHGISLKIHGISDEFWKINKKKLVSGGSKLVFPDHHLNNYTLNITDESLLQVEAMMTSSIASKSEGKKKVLAIRVVANDASTTISEKKLKKRLYGRKKSVKNQYNKCSFKKFNLVPFKGKTETGVRVKNGVGEVNLSINIKNNEKNLVEWEILKASREKYGDLPSQFDHIIICMPPGTGTWIAYATMGGWKSVYNDKWCDNLTTLQHEIGHNINLDHSGEGNNNYGYYNYGDESCPMGFGSYNTHLVKDGIDRPRCFNGAKSWQLDWYSEGQVTIDSSSPNFEGNLIGVVYYNQLNSDKVLIQIRGNKDYYVAFNHKAKFNSLPLEGANLVMITSKINSPYTSGDSNLEARLDEGDSFIVEGTYEIKVIEINKSTDRYYAKLKIGAESCTADSDCYDSNDECIYSRCSWDGLCVRELNCHNCGKTSVLVEVVTDHYPERTSWSIEKDGTTLFENDPFRYKFAMYNKRVCLGKGKFKFTMNMSGKDVCCPKTREGYYALSKGNVVLNQDILSNKKKKVINLNI